MKVPESISVCSGARGEEINCHSENTFLKMFCYMNTVWLHISYNAKHTCTFE